MPVIEVANLRKKYGDTVAVDDVSFTVDHGEIFGILGPNGAGKTTTVECVIGLRKRDGGTVSVLGLDPDRDWLAVKRRVGIQLQESAMPDRITVAEALKLYASFHRDPADPRQLMDALGLDGKKYYRTLSGGQKQRLSIALALVGNPDVAVLDELTTGLDPQARRTTWELVADARARGVTILLVTHFMEEAERLCDRLALIDRGRVAAIDSPAGLVSRVDAGQRLRFRPAADLDEAVLTALPQVISVTRTAGQVVVAGTNGLLRAVTATGIDLVDLRVEQTSLEDAFVALTGRRFEHSE